MERDPGWKCTQGRSFRQEICSGRRKFKINIRCGLLKGGFLLENVARWIRFQMHHMKEVSCG